MSWKGFANTAAMAVLACGSAAYASLDGQVDSIDGSSQLVSPVFLDDATTAPATAPTTEAAPASAPAETTLTPVMYLLDP
ncbi:MAG: hypothetical protein ABSB33_06005, partial [Tepidisphaeraceae bacterium]